MSIEVGLNCVSFVSLIMTNSAWPLEIVLKITELAKGFSYAFNILRLLIYLKSLKISETPLNKTPTLLESYLGWTWSLVLILLFFIHNTFFTENPSKLDILSGPKRFWLIRFHCTTNLLYYNETFLNPPCYSPNKKILHTKNTLFHLGTV